MEKLFLKSCKLIDMIFDLNTSRGYHYCSFTSIYWPQ